MTITTQRAASMETHDTEPTMRLAMREVCECAYRTLMANGASNAQAQTAARQVLFAEVHYGTGLAALASWLKEGPLVMNPLAYTRTDTAMGRSFAVDAATRCHALAHGALLVDAASTGVGSEVLCNAVDHESHLLDEALLNAAATSGFTIVQRNTDDSKRTTFATPAGVLGIGFSTVCQGEPHHDPQGNYATRIYTSTSTPRGDFALSTKQERDARRVDLAHSGILVDAAIWAELRAVAAGYLVADA